MTDRPVIVFQGESHEAGRARSLLASEGFDARLVNDAMGTSSPIEVTGGGVPCTQVVVHPDDVERARAILIEQRGIGRWTADVFLLMALGRPDVWPPGDIALIKSAQHVKRLRERPDDERLDRIARRWRPWRSVAARLLWHDYLQRLRT